MWEKLDVLRSNFHDAMVKHPVATLIGILIFSVLCCIADKACNSEKRGYFKDMQDKKEE